MNSNKSSKKIESGEMSVNPVFLQIDRTKIVLFADDATICNAEKNCRHSFNFCSEKI